MGSFHNRPELRNIRKDLRNNGTPAEAMLWIALKNKQLDGLKFRRQHSFGLHIVVDFYNVDFRLAIELDGQGHYEPIGRDRDEQKELFLRQRGIRVVRFENKEVFEDLDRVLDEIRMACRERPAQS